MVTLTTPDEPKVYKVFTLKQENGDVFLVVKNLETGAQAIPVVISGVGIRSNSVNPTLAAELGWELDANGKPIID